MRSSSVPPRQGLYDPAYEHDACGVGFVVDVHGRRSRRLLDNALEVLTNLNHRAAPWAATRIPATAPAC